MARIRTIKPEFPQSESMGRVSRDARLLFIQLWTIADDSGRLRGNSRMLASLLFPYDLDAGELIDDWLIELDRERCIKRYSVNGDTYLEICNWLNHQKIDKPSKSKMPEFDESSRILANPRERSSGDQGSRIKDQGRDQGSKDQGTVKAAKTPPPEWFIEFKSVYPPRAGDPNWSGALRAANSRKAEGHTEAEFLAGARRYAAFVLAKGDGGTEFVQQASRFLGPGKPFLLPWNPPAEKENDTDRLLRLNGRGKKPTTTFGVFDNEPALPALK